MVLPESGGFIPAGHEVSSRILADMPVGFAEVNLEGKFLRVNTFMHDLLDFTQGEILSLSLPEIVLDKYAKNDKDLFDQLMTGEVTSYTVVKALHKNGSRVGKPRCVWGSLTVFRIPLIGPIESYWILFVPHNDTREDGRWTLKDVLHLIRDHWRLIMTVVGIASALVTGNVTAVYELLQKQQSIEQKLQEQSPSSLSSEELSPRQPQSTPSEPPSNDLIN
jgi:PAS domain S-box-containing protein